ncbi:MAG TPA: acetylxylan esterase [Tepidisphaeraceae bacterium]
MNPTTRQPNRLFTRLWFFAVLACAGACPAQELVLTPDHPDGIYQIGEKAVWQVEWKSPTTAPSTVSYTAKQGGLKEIASGTLTLGHPAAVGGKLDSAGALLVEVKTTGSDGKEYRGVGGAIAQPDAIKPSSPRPDDFDSFWDAKLKELASVPPNPVLQAGDGGKPGVEYFKITMDNIRGTHIQGQLARPARGAADQKLPALLIVQWAGVYGLEKGWVTDRAADGWLALNINPHDIPIDQQPEFYKQQLEGPLKNYWEIGNDDRDTSYFLRMYLSCYRAAEYLTSREDWDGKTLVVMGASQGGMQSLMTAAIHPKITAALADVPAGCDMLGPDIGRAPGFPMWYWKTEGRDSAKVRNASRYYDVVNFTPQIKCPVLVGIGLLDEVCPPEGCFAATNLIQSPKEIHLMPLAQHQEINKSHDPFSKRCWEVWLPALRKGQAAPVER